MANSEEVVALAESVVITEERKSMVDLLSRRTVIVHSVVLHRDGASAADLRAMIRHLEVAGMPGEATLKVDGPDGHTRVWARWAEEIVVGEVLSDGGE